MNNNGSLSSQNGVEQDSSTPLEAPSFENESNSSNGFFHAIKHTASPPSDIFSTSDEDQLYKKIGFYCAIQNPNDPLAKFENILSVHAGFQYEKIQEKKQSITTFKAITEKQIETIEERIIKWIDFDKKVVVDLKEEETEIKTELKDLNGELSKAIDSFKDEKKAILANRINETQESINQLLNNYESTYAQKSTQNDSEYTKFKNSIDYSITHLTKKREQIQSRYDKILEKIKNLNRDGVNPYIYNFLTWVGFAGVFAGGWYYAVYALAQNLSNESIIFFLIRGLFTFGATLDLASDWYKPLLAIVILLVILFGIGLIATWSRRFSAQSDDKTANQMLFELNQQYDNQFSASFKANSPDALWWQIMPFIFISGLVAILLFLARTNAANVNTLDVSLSAQVTGSLYTLLISGLFIIYFIKIVEPRIEKNQHRNLLWQNFELVTIVLMYIIIYAIIIFTQGVSNGKLALLNFILISLITGVPLAYGVIYLGLTATENYLNQKINNIDRVIGILSAPPPLPLVKEENKLFKDNYLKLNEQLYNLIARKNELGLLSLGEKRKRRKKNQPQDNSVPENILSTEPEPKKNNILVKRFFSSAIRFFRENTKNRREAKNTLVFTDSVDLLLYPHHDISILYLQESIQNKENRLKEIKERFAEINKEEYIQGLENEINRLLNSSEQFKENCIKEIDDIKIKTEKQLVSLQDGFNLGMLANKYKLNDL